MNLDLTEKNALVCGSTQGIGRASAVALADLGATVTLLARNAETLAQVCDTLPTSKGQSHRFVQADFSNLDTVRAALTEHVHQTPTTHILINNTGGPPGGPALEAELTAYLSAFNNHLLCNQLLVQSLVPGMKSAGYGRIVNIISTSVKQPLPNLGVSNTIRGAVANWAKTLATELGAFGITVNNVLPGATETGRLHTIIQNKAHKMGVTTVDIASAMQQAIPARRFAQPEEVAAAVAFLASPAAGYINGINLPVDGGRTGCL